MRDNIHSLDVARFMAAFVESPRAGEVYNLGGGKANSTSILEAFKIVEKFSGKAQIYTYVDQNGDTQVFPGYNWSADGQAIWQNDCNAVPEPVTEPLTPTLQCVEGLSGGGFLAHFGYENPNSAAVEGRGRDGRGGFGREDRADGGARLAAGTRGEAGGRGGGPGDRPHGPTDQPQ